MPTFNPTRRRMLLAISQAAMLSTLAACGGAEQPVDSSSAAETDLELLAAVAYDLFPYPEVPAELYVRIGERLQASGNPVIAEGLAALRDAAGERGWADIDEQRRVAILTELEDSPFFATIRATSIEVLYRSPEVFAMVGYGGSAIEHGGYINRGFDDIDWLPEN